MTEASDPKPRVLSSARLIVLGTIAGSVALSIVSAYETWLGLLDFMPTGLVGRGMAFVLTFGVQVILFAISWSIAEHLRDGWRAMVWRIPVWILCAFFSGYFSFYGFFQGTGGRNDETRASVIQSERGKILADIDSRLVRDLEQQNQTTLVQSRPYIDWIAALDQVIEAANGAKPQIEANARDASAALRAAQTRLRDERFQVTNALGQLSAQADLARRALDGLRARSAELVIRHDALSARIQTLTTDLAALVAQRDLEARTGEGPRFNDLVRDANSADAALQAARRTLEGIRAEREDLAPELADAEALASAGAVETRRSEMTAERARIDAELASIDQKIATLAQGVDFDFQGQSAALTSAKSALEGKDYDAHETLVEQCSLLRQQLAEAALAQTAIDCSDSQVLVAINALRRLQARLAEFRETCRAQQPPIRRRDGGAGYVLDPVIRHLEDCIEYEPAQDLKQDLRLAIGAMKTGRGDAAQPINQAAIALFADAQGNAVLSAVFAAIVDLLVLLCALVGKNAGLPESVRAIDLLLGLMRRPAAPIEGVEFIVPCPTDDRTEGMIARTISQLIREGFAEYDTDEHTGAQRYLLKTGARSYLARLRSQHISERRVTSHAPAADSGDRRPGRRRAARSI